MSAAAQVEEKAEITAQKINAKTDELHAQSEKIHVLVNSNLATVKADLEAAKERQLGKDWQKKLTKEEIAALHQLVKDLTKQR